MNRGAVFEVALVLRSNKRRLTPDVEKEQSETPEAEGQADKIKLVDKEAHAESTKAALTNSEDQLTALAEKLKGTSEIAKLEEDRRDATP